MYTEKIEYLNCYEKEKHTIYFHSVSSDFMTAFNDCFLYFDRIVREFDGDYLRDGYVEVKLIFKILRNSIHPYHETLSNINWVVITEFFNRVTELDNSSKTMEMANRFFKLLKKVESNELTNFLFPVVEEYVSSTAENQSVCIVTRDRFIDVPKGLRHRNIEILTPSDLMNDNEIYDFLIYMGTPRYFYQFSDIFFGRKIVYVSFDFYRNSFEKSNVLIKNNEDVFSNVFENVTINYNTNELLYDFQELEQEIIIEQDTSKRWLSDYQKSYKKMDEELSALLIEFSTNKGVFYMPTSKVRIITFNNKNSLSHIPVKDLVGGEWIVLKKSIEDEYLNIKAKEILGEKDFLEYSNLILDYKRRLRRKKHYFETYEDMRKDMVRNGVKVSSAMLLRAWTTDFIIKPRKLEGILKYLGYSKQDIEKTVLAGGQLVGARIRGGMLLQSNLTKIIEKIDKKELISSMRMNKFYEFQIPEIGEFVIEIVKNKPDIEMEIPIKDLYQVVDFSEVNIVE